MLDSLLVFRRFSRTKTGRAVYIQTWRGTRYRNPFFNAKAISITCFECVSAALFIRWAKRMRRISLSSPAVPYHFTISKTSRLFWAGNIVTEHRVCLIFCTTLSETFLVLRIRAGITINVVCRSSCKVPEFLSDFNVTWIFSTDSRKRNVRISDLMKIRPARTELFRAYRQTWRSY